MNKSTPSVLAMALLPSLQSVFPRLLLWLVWGLTSFLMLVAAPAKAMSEADFLPPEQAFRMSAVVVQNHVLEVTFAIAPGYYLYREQFNVAATSDQPVLGPVTVPAGKVIYDAVFEKNLETHHQSVVLQVPLAGDPRPVTVMITSQGCAEAGLCYPPQTWPVHLAAQGGSWVASVALPETGWANAPTGLNGWLEATDLGLADALANAALWQTVAVFFVLGVLLSLTPCVLPMLPILSSLLVGDQANRTAQGLQPSRWRGLALAASYVLGMSLVYAVVGVLAGLTGASLAATLQTPWVLAVFAVLLVVLALAMFDVVSVQMPGRWQTTLSAWVDRFPGGRLTGVFGMGAISALIVGPCVAAPLAGALIYISQTGDVWVGALALFALAWGMGVTLLLAGASAGWLLPRAGVWMIHVKQCFGMLLLGVAWWMLLPVLPMWLQMLGWAVLAMLAASLLGAFSALPAGASVGSKFAKALGFVLMVWSVVLLLSVGSGGRDVLQPLAHWVSVDSRAIPPLAMAPASNIGQAPVDEAPLGQNLAGQSGNGWLTDIGSGSRRQDSAWLTDQSVTALPSSSQGSALSVVAGSPSFRVIGSVAELEAALAQSQGRPVMLDFYADWCVSCKEMERFTFSQPDIASRMSQMVLLKADVTANTAEHQALLRRFRLFGPPGIIFFDPQGREQTTTRVVGFQAAERFATVLDRVLGR